MSLAKVELKAAVEAALSGDVLANDSGALLREAFQSFVDGRFAGGAEAVRRVHDLRQQLCERTDLLTDYSDSEPGPYDTGHTIGKIAGISTPPDSGRILYHLVRALKPQSAIEMGTNIGLSSSYIATGLMLNGGGRLATLEASQIRHDLAQALFDDLGIDNVVLIPGYFADTLVPALEEHGPIDFAFIDGDHQEDPTISYFDTLCHHKRSGAVLVFDDIRWSEGMFRAWNHISNDKRVQTAVDLGWVGIAVTD